MTPAIPTYDDAEWTREHRAALSCPHFGPCGGCQLQHITYAGQLEGKAARLTSLLAPYGMLLPELQVHASPPLAYRNRIRLTLCEVEGQLRAGYIRGAAGEQMGVAESFLPIRQCPIAAPILWRVTEAFLGLANAEPSLWLRSPQYALDQLEVFTTSDESRLQMTLYVRSGAKALPVAVSAAFGTLCETMRTAVPELAGGGIAVLPAMRRSRRNETARAGPMWGAPGLHYRAAETDYWVPRVAFFQVNRFLLPELVKLVTTGEGQARTGVLAWDLYAGAGLFSRPLARSFAQVVAVEIAEAAFAALKGAKLPNLTAVQATTVDFLRGAVVQREWPSLVVLDPPRSGAGPEVCGLLARVAAPTLVYVSCSPDTLPADLAVLTASGYTIAELHLLDLFPQTTHMETLVVLTR